MGTFEESYRATIRDLQNQPLDTILNQLGGINWNLNNPNNTLDLINALNGIKSGIEYLLNNQNQSNLFNNSEKIFSYWKKLFSSGLQWTNSYDSNFFIESVKNENYINSLTNILLTNNINKNTNLDSMPKDTALTENIATNPQTKLPILSLIILGILAFTVLKK